MRKVTVLDMLNVSAKIRGVIFDLGDTLIDQVIDDSAPLNQLTITLRPSASETLERLQAKGFKLAILSNTEQTTTAQLREVLVRLGIEQHFDAILTSSDLASEGITEPAKPSKKPYERILGLLKLPPCSCVMVGNDLEHDIRGATSCGINAILCEVSGRPGAVPEHDIEIAVASVERLDEIDRCIQLMQEANTQYWRGRIALKNHQMQESARFFKSAAEISLLVNDRPRAMALLAVAEDSPSKSTTVGALPGE